MANSQITDFLTGLGYAPDDAIYIRLLPAKGFNPDSPEHRELFPKLAYEREHRNGAKAWVPSNKNLKFHDGALIWQCKKGDRPIKCSDPWEWIQAQSQNGFCPYIVVNPGGQNKKEITTGRVAFWEHDELDKPTQIERFMEYADRWGGAMAVETRSSIHCYIRLDQELPPNLIQPTLKRVIALMGSDPSVNDECRLMRIPGFDHIKMVDTPSGWQAERFPITLLHSWDGTFASWEAIDRELPTEAPKPTPKSAPKPLTLSTVSDADISKILANDILPRLSVAQIFNWTGHDFQEDSSGKLKGNCPWHDSQSGTSFWITPSQDGGTHTGACPTCTDNKKLNPIAYRYALRTNNPQAGQPTGREFIEVVKELAADAGVQLPAYQPDRLHSIESKVRPPTAAATPQGNRPALVAIDGGGKVEESSDEAEYQADLETFRESESALQALSAARFSDRPEEFFLGTGKIYEVCGGEVRDNIRNGWLAGSLAIGQVLASLCPRQARILPPCQMTSKQGMLAFIAIEAPKNSGKSVVFESISPFIRGLKRIDASRMIEHKEVRAELKAMADSEEGSPPEFVENPSLSNVPPIVQVGDSTMPALKSVIAASGYWTYAAKFTRRQIRSAGTLIYSREGVSLFESFGQNNQSEQGVKACFSGFWASEQESVLRKTNSELTMPEDSTVGILTACQAGQMRNLIESEIRKKRGAIDVGFALRFASVDLLNTLASKDRKFVPRDYEAELRQAENPVDLHPVMEKFAAAVASAKNTPILCDEQAIVFFSDVWIPWVNNQSWTGWLDGYEAKASANLMRLAWAYRCMDIFDEIASGTSHPDLVITWTAMERAFEVLERSTAKFVYEVALIEKNQTLYEKAREAEKQQSLVRSKYYVTFTDPAMTHHWVSEKRAGGCSSFRLLVQKVKGSTRSELKQQGVDVTAILRPIWDALETASTPIVASKVEPDAFEYAYEETAA